MGVVEYFFPEFADVEKLFLVFVGDAFECPVGVAYFLELFVQGLSVPGYLPQIPFDADEFLAGPGFRIPDYAFRQPHLAGKLEGE